ncbi:MAG: hypothetical protein DDT22_01300 [candidate division WS2 bacterium]|nr:hypothetical protein [Candidatus Lithacetigena glycinireducens]
MKQARPELLLGTTHRRKTGCGSIYVTVNKFQGKPFEVFISGAKAGVCSQVMCSSLGVVISLYLRNGCSWEELVKGLKGITCMAQGEMKSCTDAIARAIEESMSVKEEVVEWQN